MNKTSNWCVQWLCISGFMMAWSLESSEIILANWFKYSDPCYKLIFQLQLHTFIFDFVLSRCIIIWDTQLWVGPVIFWFNFESIYFSPVILSKNFTAMLSVVKSEIICKANACESSVFRSPKHNLLRLQHPSTDTVGR